MKLRVALLFQDGNFVGREYYHALIAAGIEPSLVIAVGAMARASIAIELERTAGRWTPPDLPDDLAVKRFESLQSPALWQILGDAGIDVAIQGGIGILDPSMIEVPAIGFLNVHPGKLPLYRGSSCPEWALYNGDQIYATAHLIDERIDTGPVICEARYEIEKGWDYYDTRAHLYAHCATVMVRALNILDVGVDDPAAVLAPQDEDAGRYWKPISQDKLEAVIAEFRR